MRLRLATLLCGTSLAVAQPAPPAQSPVPTQLPPEGPTQTATPTEEDAGLRFKGFVQSSYSANYNRPSNGTNLYHGYDETSCKWRTLILRCWAAKGCSRTWGSGYPTRPRSPPPPALDQDLAQESLFSEGESQIPAGWEEWDAA